MKSRLSCIVWFTLLLTNSWSQSAVETKELTIKNSFEQTNLEVYALQSQLKVNELFEYLDLLSRAENPLELNNQLQENIHQLFTDASIQLQGIDNKLTFSAVGKWINDWRNAKINVDQLELMDSQLKNTHWVNSYRLTYKINGKQVSRKLEIQVFFQPQIKKFGEQQKEVWEIKIGNIYVK